MRGVERNSRHLATRLWGADPRFTSTTSTHISISPPGTIETILSLS